jgi:hypothetical protein
MLGFAAALPFKSGAIVSGTISATFSGVYNTIILMDSGSVTG